MGVNPLEERKNFLARLKNRFGDCSRQSLLQKLRGRFSGSEKKSDENILDINGTDAWRNHIEKLKDLSIIADCISKSSMTPFVKTVTNFLNDIPKYIDKHFKEPADIDEDTGEDVARQTGKLVKEYIRELLRGCHNGMKHNQGTEKIFYESFHNALEKYLSSIVVYRKNITEGMDIRSNAKWFETPCIRETSLKSRIGKIDEIEVSPYFIPYRDENGEKDELILKGICIAFGEAKKGVR